LNRNFHFLLLLVLLSCTLLQAQHTITIDGVLDVEKKMMTIIQEMEYHNNADIALHEIFLLDWTHSFSSKTTPLGKRFTEEYIRRFHFSKATERGYTTIKSITTALDKPLSWERKKEAPDLLKITLPKALLPGDKCLLKLNYHIKIPDDKFTRFGYNEKEDVFNLRYWYITPAVYHGDWKLYSNKNLNDLYTPLANYKITLQVPERYNIETALDFKTVTSEPEKSYTYEGQQRNYIPLYIKNKTEDFYCLRKDELQFISNLEDNALDLEIKTIAVHKILNFLEAHLGSYPFQKLIVTNRDYEINPVYGLNQLPDIIRPFPDGFQYEIKQLKATTGAYLKTTMHLDPRSDAWAIDAIQVYLMSQYINKHYPNIKLLGKLSELFGLRWFHASDLTFNDQYFLGYKNMLRRNLHQSLKTPLDSLVKFNKNIANPYKAGIGLHYLDDFLGNKAVAKSIKDFYQQEQLKATSSLTFEQLLQSNASKNIDWFFDEYVSQNDPIDFKIKKVRRRKDSLDITITNSNGGHMPVPLMAFQNDQTALKTWVTPEQGKKTITLPRTGIKKLALDYEQIIPEVNQRNNYRNLKGVLNKPLQFRILQDIEDPAYSQLFLLPEFEFNNVYDGFTIGTTVYNKTLIKRNFNYRLTPKYGFNSKTIIGSASIFNTRYLNENKFKTVRYGLSYSGSSYAPGLFFRSFTPFLTFRFREKDLRDNKRHGLSFRSINIFRDRDANNPVETPDYSVFNARYTYTNPSLIDLFAYRVDYQLAKKFGKISTTINYRKLFLDNRELRLRLFAGTFLFNNTKADGDFFSFALDRPTDYLFDFNYLGRTSSTGLVTQQIIISEGGFKSKLNTPFSNQWITTLNGGYSIWNWIHAYGDIGCLKSKGTAANFVYDSGIRLSLVNDYFELFLPVYSNRGWEIADANYNERIRFIVTISPSTLIGLFNRRWY